VDRAPQAEAFAERAAERLRPVFAWLYGERRRVATAAICTLTVWLFLHVMFGSNGMVVYRQKRAEYEDLQKEVTGLQKQNQQYNQQIQALRTDPETIEKEAREHLHYAKPGEVIYVAPPAPPPPPANAESAHKIDR
jgi:cell division protein FtsB